MIRSCHKGKKLSVDQWNEIVEKMQQSSWEFDCEPLSFVVAKLFDVHPWQVGPLAHFHDGDDWLGTGYLGWTPISQTEMSAETLYDDCEVIVVTKEGKEVARKKVADFTFVELLEYCTLHPWILPEKDIESLPSWKFSQDELRKLWEDFNRKPWGLTDKEEEELRSDSRFDTSRGSIGIFRPAVGRLNVGKESIHYLGTTFVNIKPDPDITHTISAGAHFYILDAKTRSLVDSFQAGNITLELVYKYATGFAWVEASHAYKDRIEAYDAEVAKNRKK